MFHEEPQTIPRGFAGWRDFRPDAVAPRESPGGESQPTAALAPRRRA